MAGRQCLDSTCRQFVRASEQFCPRHRPPQGAKSGTGPDAGDPEAIVESRFEQRLELGEYRALFDLNVKQVIDQAAAHATEHGLIDELGALRMVLARILLEEKDLSRLATNVTRVASVAVRAAQAQRVISGQAADGLTDALTTILIEINGAKS